jgi:hypothetical protein
LQDDERETCANRTPLYYDSDDDSARDDEGHAAHRGRRTIDRTGLDAPPAAISPGKAARDTGTGRRCAATAHDLAGPACDLAKDRKSRHNAG